VSVPTASPELRARWHDKPGGGDYAAEQHLRSRGFKLYKWHWIEPPGHVYSDDDESALLYLMYEWDYGRAIAGPEELG
jgi:hypothetical protein